MAADKRFLNTRIITSTIIPGFANGFKFPSLQLILAVNQRNILSIADGLKRLYQAMEMDLHEEAKKLNDIVLGKGNVEDIALSLTKMTYFSIDKIGGCSLGHPIVRPPSAESFANEKHILVQIPTLWPELYQSAMVFCTVQLDSFASQQELCKLSETTEREWRRFKAQAQGVLPSGKNNRRLLQAASAIDAPIFRLGANVFQYGMARRARLLRSTMTESTSGLAVQICRDKVATNGWLRAAGIAVPTHAEVADKEGAVAVADRLGYPVVVKPADMDAGAGAYANLRNSEAVRRAYAQARNHSTRVLVEKHIEGREYRITVVQGEVFWAHERVPAIVIGDGSSTLNQLIDKENERRKAKLIFDPESLAPIVINENYIKDTGFSLTYIPDDSQKIRLQPIPFYSGGGNSEVFTESIHPDNALLATRAARMLRLDVAGIDMIMPDITRSWRDVGGAITEVNALPQLTNLSTRDLMQRLLKKLLLGKGRVPIFVILGEAPANLWLEILHDRLEEAGLRCGISTNQGIRIGRDQITISRTSAFSDARTLQLDPIVGAIIVVTDGQEFLKTGLPFDAFDCLLVTEPLIKPLILMAAHCKGPIFTSTPEVQGVLQRTFADKISLSGFSDGVAGTNVALDAVHKELLAAERRHSGEADMISA